MNRKESRNWFTISMGVVVVFLLVTGTSVLAQDNDRDVSDNHFCTNTSKAALKACRHEAWDDYWIDIGNCNNLSDRHARKECKAEAKAERKEAREECVGQYEARLVVCGLLGEAPYDPQIDPADFVGPSGIGKTVTPNPYFPLVPGTTWVYEGGDEIITVSVLEDTKEILGVTCAVVRDVVQEDGEVIEDTRDWYAQDVEGNVWYFGEIALEFQDGELVSLEGSWLAGDDSAKPGILMQAMPQVGHAYRQEFLLGEAEDLAEVLSVSESATTSAVSCDGDCVVANEYTPIEPDAVEHNFYAPGIGPILEVDPDTGERVELVAFEPGN